MATFISYTCSATLTFLTFCFSIQGMSAAEGNPFFSFNGFRKDPSFEANIALYGDAEVVNGSYSIRMTDSVSSSAGRVMYKKPIKLFNGKEKSFASFSNYFSLSMSNESGGDVLAFVMVPSGLNLSLFGNDNSSFGFPLEFANNETEVVAIKFDTSEDVKHGDLNENHVGIHVGNLLSAKISNLSSVSNFALSNGEKLHCWIDYEASSKRIEVRLSKSGDRKPVDPLISYSIDLSKLWKDKEVFMGFSSSNGNSSETCFLYAWSFKLRHFPIWMHSQPLDPQGTSETEKEKPLVVRKRSDCVLRMLGALVLGAVCGTLVAFLVLYLWTICGSRRPMVVVPEECAVKPEDSDYKKVEVMVVDKVGEQGKK